MKKILFLMFAVVTIVTSCEKGGDVVAPIDVQLMGEDIDLMDCRYYEQSHRISIKTDGAWELVCSEDWISSGISKGVGTDTTYVALERNITDSAREGWFKVVNAAGGSSETFKVKQGSLADFDDNANYDDFIATYGYFKKNGFCEIYTAAGLAAFGKMDEETNGILMNDIDLSGIDNWTPMFEDDDFEGHFYGANHTIKNLKIVSNEDEVGLFAELNNSAHIYDLHLENVDVRGYGEYTGALVGDLWGSDGDDVAWIHNCSVSGKVVGNYAAGGLVGRSDFGLFTYCANYADVSIFTDETYPQAGGIVGQGDASSSIVACYNTGDIYGESSKYAGFLFLGGIVGYAEKNNNYIYIRASYSDGEVIGTVQDPGCVVAGGILGCEDWEDDARASVSFDCFYDTAPSAFGDEEDVKDFNGLTGTVEWRRAYKREDAMNAQTTVDEMNAVIREMANSNSEDYHYEKYDKKIGAHAKLRKMAVDGNLGFFKVGDKGHPVFDENVRR